MSEKNNCSSLVPYELSESDPESNDDNKVDEIEKKALPVPDVINKVFNTEKEIIKKKRKMDGNSDYQGRVRSFPHVVGNWATHVYLPIEFDKEQRVLIESIMSKLKQNFDIKMRLCDDFHISLSKTFPIRQHSIEPLWKEVNESFENCSKTNFEITKVGYYVNDEKTRSFIGFEFDDSVSSTITDYIKRVDNCLKKSKFPTYYKNPVIHVSFCWCLDEINSSSKDDILKELNELLIMYKSTCSFNISINKLNYKSGNRLFSRKFI